MNRKDTRKRIGDRHKPGYQRDWMRKWRARKKAEEVIALQSLTGCVIRL